MSSGFSGGRSRSTVLPTTMNGGTFNTNINPQQQFSFHSPLAGILPDPEAEIRPLDYIGKRSLAEFQQQNRALGFYLRNVKQRPSTYPLSAVDLSHISPGLPYDLPIVQGRQHLSLLNRSACEPNALQNKRLGENNSWSGRGMEAFAREQSKKNIIMSHTLQELEKQLLGDEDDNETVSAVTESAWSDALQHLIGPVRKSISPSRTTSSSSCSSTSASPPLSCPKQTLVDAADAISDGRTDFAAEIIARVQHQVADPNGTPQQRLASYMVSALRPLVGSSQPAPEIYGKEHAASVQMLYDASPCFKLGLIAANLAILDATVEQGLEKIHILDFDIGQGGQYMHFIQALASKKKAETTRYDSASLKITAVVDNFTAGAGQEKLKIVSEGLRALANKIGIPLTFNVKHVEIAELTREKLEVGKDEALAVNFAFRLYRLPDESVTTDNLRDETLRRVRDLSPEVVAMVEQEMNTNTAPLPSRVRGAWEYYGLLLESLGSMLARDSPDRVRIEEGLGRRMVNAVACEGLDRVERCEVFGKWRARMNMAGFQPRQISQVIVDSLRSKVKSGIRGNTGCSMSEESNGVGFGWMGQNLTVASAWR